LQNYTDSELHKGERIAAASNLTNWSHIKC